MKRISISLGILTIVGVSAQENHPLGVVGINTEKPNATLEINGTPNNPNITDGLIAPKIKGIELKNKDALYDNAQKGALVYVTEALPNSAKTPKTALIDRVGYYYFNGEKWIRMGSDIHHITNTSNPLVANVHYNNGTTGSISLPKGQKGDNGNKGNKGQKGDRGDVGSEPWLLQNSTTKAEENTQNIYQNANVGIGDFSTTASVNNKNNDTHRLDVKGKLKIRKVNNPPKIKVRIDGKEKEIYDDTFKLAADENGVVFKIFPESFLEGGTIFATKNVLISKPNAKTATSPLGVSQKITIPAKSKRAILLYASVPIGTDYITAYNNEDITVRLADYKEVRRRGKTIKVFDENKDIRIPKRIAGYYGFSIKKTPADVGRNDVEEVSFRKVPIAEKTDGSMFAMTTVNSQVYDLIDNSNGTEPITVEYSLEGYVEKGEGVGNLYLDNYKIQFNMYDVKGNPNYNWGRSSLSYQVYVSK